MMIQTALRASVVLHADLTRAQIAEWKGIDSGNQWEDLPVVHWKRNKKSLPDPVSLGMYRYCILCDVILLALVAASWWAPNQQFSDSIFFVKGLDGSSLVV